MEIFDCEQVSEILLQSGISVSGRTISRWLQSGKIEASILHERNKTAIRYFTDEDIQKVILSYQNKKNMLFVPNGDNELYDVGSAAEKIGISFMTLRRWLEANTVEYSYKYKNHVLFSESDIQRIIEKKRKKKKRDENDFSNLFG